MYKEGVRVGLRSVGDLIRMSSTRTPASCGINFYQYEFFLYPDAREDVAKGLPLLARVHVVIRDLLSRLRFLPLELRYDPAMGQHVGLSLLPILLHEIVLFLGRENLERAGK